MIYKRDKEVVKRQVAGESFLIPVRSRLADMSNIYVLHGTGEFIWDRLDKDAAQICDAMVDEFEVERDEAERIAWSAPGISRVQNCITITPWGSGPAEEWGY